MLGIVIHTIICFMFPQSLLVTSTLESGIDGEIGISGEVGNTDHFIFNNNLINKHVLV